MHVVLHVVLHVCTDENASLGLNSEVSLSLPFAPHQPSNLQVCNPVHTASGSSLTFCEFFWF